MTPWRDLETSDIGQPIPSVEHPDGSLHPATVTPAALQARRGKLRERRIVSTALAGIGARGISIVTAFITVPLTLDYLGQERYGLWMTISSLVALINFADLGLGFGLMNSISRRLAGNDRAGAQRDISSAFALLILIAIALGAAFAAVYPIVPWQGLFNVTSPVAVREAGPAMCVFAGVFALGIPLQVVGRVQMGYQNGFVHHAWVAAGNILALLGVLAVIQFHGGLPWLVLAMAGTPVIAAGLNHLLVFGYQKPYLRPRLGLASRAEGLHLLRPGLFFVALQVTVAIAYSSDHIIIAQILGPEDVTQYSIPFRLFNLVFVVAILAVAPLWPAYAEAAAARDVDWMRQTLAKSLTFTVSLTLPAASLLLIFGRPIIERWTGGQVSPSFTLLGGLAVWTVLGSTGNTVTMLLNGLGVVKTQALFALVMTVTNVGLTILLTQRVGLAGAIWATSIAFGTCFAVPIWILSRRALATLEHEENLRG